MNNLNEFFRKIFGSPALLWKAGAGLLFISLSAAIIFVPSITAGVEDKLRYSFAILLLIYGIFRFGTFYMEYKKPDDE